MCLTGQIFIIPSSHCPESMAEGGRCAGHGFVRGLLIAAAHSRFRVKHLTNIRDVPIQPVDGACLLIALLAASGGIEHSDTLPRLRRWDFSMDPIGEENGSLIAVHTITTAAAVGEDKIFGFLPEHPDLLHRTAGS